MFTLIQLRNLCASIWITVFLASSRIDKTIALTVVPTLASHVAFNTMGTTLTINQPTVILPDKMISDGINSWWLANSGSDPLTRSSLTVASVEAPSEQDVTLLRNAFAEMYRPIKSGPRDYEKAYQLLSDAIVRWEQQSDDERAGLYRVRGDCNMIRTGSTSSSFDLANNAYSDYNMAVSLLQRPEVRKLADPQEYPASLLGRARASKSLSNLIDIKKDEKRRYVKSAADDYRSALIALGKVNAMDDDEIYDDSDRLEEGMKRNPYAAWEWGDSIWKSGNNYVAAADIETQASTYFGEIGDRARSVISQIDAGIALAAAPDLQEVPRAEAILLKAIQSTIGVTSRDERLLERVITKEGEGRMALAALLWNDGKRMEAETILGEACIRLDQLQAQIDLNASRNKGAINPITDEPRLLYSIDDNTGSPRDKVLSCSDFKKPQFMAEKLEWPDSLQKKVIKLETLQ